jgi:hypothetical protein
MVLALMAVAVVSCGSSADGVAGSDTQPSATIEIGSDREPETTGTTTLATTAPVPTSATASPTTTANDTSGGLDAYCALFGDIQASTAESSLDSEAGWQERVAWTEEMARLAPEGYEDRAQVYLALVLAREALVSEYGYVSVQELPADVRGAFISDHAAEQQISNELIEFSTSTCLAPADDQ